MFRLRFQDEVDYYERREDNENVKCCVALGLTLLVIGFSWQVAALFFTTDSPEQATICVLIFGLGVLGLFATFKSISCLFDVFCGGYRYLKSFKLPNHPVTNIPFHLATLYDVTLKNSIFYGVCLSLGHLVGVYKRSVWNHQLQEPLHWNMMIPYAKTYVFYPVCFLLVGVLVVTLGYFLFTIAQKPLISFWQQHQGASLHKRMQILHCCIQRGITSEKKKSVVMLLGGLIPTCFIILYNVILHELPITWVQWLLLYGCISVLSTLCYFAQAVVLEYRKQNKPKTIREKWSKTTKAKTKSIDNLFVSEKLPTEIQEPLQELNDVFIKMHHCTIPLPIETKHIAQRMMQEEIPTLLAHYQQLPEELKEDAKKDVMKQLKQATNKLQELMKEHNKAHYELFKKQADLMEQRYATKQDT